MKQIEVKEKSVYGRTLIYPICNDAMLFAQLLNVKTFTDMQLDGIRALGYNVNIVSL